MAVATMTTTTTSPSVSSSPSTATDDSTSEASPSSSQNSYNAGGGSPTHTLTTVMPAFLIAFICVFSLFLACGVFYGRRRRLMLLRHMPSAPAQAPLMFAPPPPRSRKKKRLVRPKLWEVDAKETHWTWAPDLEALEPVAVELQAVSRPKSKAGSSDGQKRSNNWYIPGLSRSHKPQECDNAPIRHAQVMVLIAMPSLERAAGCPSREYVIGTTSLPYRTPEPEEEEDPEIRHMKLRLALCEAVLD